ncbi:ABC transporter permease [Micrococcales bacterium 31B]|nr:ABC transporter permease [Micrococcales bacterium 31B]
MSVATQPPQSAAKKPEVDDRLVKKGPLSLLFSRPETGSLIGAVAIFILFAIVASPTFTSPGAIANILYLASTYGIMAVGVSLLMIGGEFDLSAGVGVYSSALFASLFGWYFTSNVWVSVILSLVFALAVGAFNGWLLIKTGLPSFVVTLGSFLMLAGLNLAITRLVSGSVSSPKVSDMEGFTSARAVFGSSFTVGGIDIKITVIYWLLLVAVGTYILLRTNVGNWIFAVGGNSDAARAVGVPVNATKIGLFMGVGFCGWLLGMFQMLSQNGVVQSGQGVGNEFFYIIAAVVGGCLLTGGYGSAIGGAIGALIFGMVQAGIVYAEWNPDLFKFFLGGLLLLATIVNLQVKKRAEKG